MFNIFKQLTERRICKYASNDVEFPYMNELHISVVGAYISNLSTTCHLPKLPSAELLTIVDEPYMEPTIVASLEQELKEIFVVPSLKMLHQAQNRINNSQLIQAFLSFLLQLLYHKADLLVYPFEHRIENLEKELRFLLTILGDISWMLLDNDVEFHELLPEFEALANQVGSFVHYLLFSPDQTFEKTDEGLAAVLNKTDLLKANLQSRVSIPAYTTPTTSIVDSILILDSVVDDLDDLLKWEDGQIADVKDQVNLLHQELLLSQSSIKEMRSPQPSNIGELKEPLMRIGGIAHQAQYLITSFLMKDAPLCYVINRLTDLNRKIEPTGTEIQVITHKYQFGGLKLAECFSAGLTLSDKRNTEVNGVTVGFDDKTREILDQLVGGGGQTLQVISILGMAGLGKTTLANKLYNHPLVNYSFDKLSWSVVSQTYKIQSVLANILIQINIELKKDKILEMEEETLVQHIYKSLKGLRYLVIMDDIWELGVWDAFRRSFPDDGNGSRVLLTSRNKDVAPPNSILHKLPFLTDDQCWELLEKKVFGSRTCPPGLQGTGRKIAAKCCGLPLTVVVIAGVLSTLDEEESTWEEVEGSLASYIDGEDNSVMQILELSYKHLPDCLKPCFLYFGKFKEDEEISVGNLKRMWVAEGFIRNENGKSRENIAEEYLIELTDKSLVMIVKRRKDGRGAKRCVIHDLLRDMCLRKCKEESFMKYANNNYYTIYEEGHLGQAFGETGPLSYCQHVRYLYGGQKTSFLHVRDMRLLRVLDIECISIFDKRLTCGIEYLVNLRYLVIDNLPTLVDRLVNLEYLRMHWQTVEYSTIVKMKKLRYLWAFSVEYNDDWDSSQTNNLEYLSWVTIKKVKDEELLKCSPHLRKLKCRYNLNENSVCPHFDLSFLTQLHSLSLDGILRKGDFGFPSNIRKLTLDESGLPWEKMSIVGRLEFLEVLKLLSNSFEGERWDTIDGEFQKLRFLQLEYIQLLEWNVASNEHFPKLQQLILISCCNLREIPGEIGEITTLELIQLDGFCLDSLAESAERIKQEQLDMGNEDLRVIIKIDNP